MSLHLLNLLKMLQNGSVLMLAIILKQQLNTTSIQDLDSSTNDDNFGDFFSKLKQNNEPFNENNNQNIDKFDTIIKNQNIIISMLNQILNK